ncbi:helix-turn-helix domain-containing protein [Allomesorhizobium alhagi]
MENQTQKLGDFLGAARRKLGLSLRAVEAATGISNAYLSQLEHGKIKTPAPKNLHALAAEYRVPYTLLMELAGYPTSELQRDAPSTASRLAARIGAVSNEEEEQLLEYLSFIRSRRRRLE